MRHENDSNTFYRKATFKAAFMGFDAWTTARIINRLHRGHDWRGCKKSHIQQEYVSGDLSFLDGAQIRKATADFTASRLRRRGASS